MKSILDKILDDQSTEPKTLLKYPEVEDVIDSISSPYFDEQENLLASIFNTEINTESKYIDTKRIVELEEKEEYITASTFSDQILLESWKNIENISARLIEFNDSNVILECLVDKEKGIYEERIFKPSLFSDYQISVGKQFYLRFFERRSEIKLQIHDDPGLTLLEDFPKISLAEKYKNSRLFK